MGEAKSFLQAHLNAWIPGSLGAQQWECSPCLWQGPPSQGSTPVLCTEFSVPQEGRGKRSMDLEQEKCPVLGLGRLVGVG